MHTASAKAFDQYGEMVSRYEKQVELKDKAESLATSVILNLVYYVIHDNHAFFLAVT